MPLRLGNRRPSSLHRGSVMRLIDFLDKGASLGAKAPCLTMAGQSHSYGDVQAFSHRVAHASQQSGVAAGDKVAILSSNDPVAFSCVFGISRAAAVWCPINPRNELAENADLLDGTDCKVLIFHSDYHEMVAAMQNKLPKITAWVCLDAELDFAQSLKAWLPTGEIAAVHVDPIDDLALLPGTGGTTGKPKSVMLTGRNMEVMSAMTLMGYPFSQRPVYLAVAPLTHAAGVLCFPVMAMGGEIVIMKTPDMDTFLDLIEIHKVTHTFLPPTVIYMLLDNPRLNYSDLSSVECFWYGAAPISPARLRDALERFTQIESRLGHQVRSPGTTTRAGKCGRPSTWMMSRPRPAVMPSHTQSPCFAKTSGRWRGHRLAAQSTPVLSRCTRPPEFS